MNTPGTVERPICVAVIGSGPSGFYATEALLKASNPTVCVDLFDRSSTPFCLVRGGVAPDQKIKAVTAVYERVAFDPRVRFFGNMTLGRDLSVEELRARYDQIVYAVGCESDRPIGIPGEWTDPSRPPTWSAGRRSDGVFRWFHNKGFPVRDTNGTVQRWCVLLTDIDDRMRAEEAVRKSEHASRLIVDSIPGLVSVVTASGEIERVNRQVTEYVGKSLEELKQWAANDIVHPEDLAGVIQAFRQSITSGDPADFEARLRRFDGAYRWFQLRSLPLRDREDRIVRWYFLHTDIEDRKRAEDQLRRNENFLATAQRLSLSGSLSWCLDTNEVTFSEEAYRIFEFERDSPVTLEEIGRRIHPDDRHVLPEKMDAARTVGEAHDYQIRLLMPDRSVKYLHTTASEIPDARGRRQYIGALQDITQRRLAEEALNTARSELAHVSRMTALSALTASIAHEINQPLSGIITNASTCLRMLDGDPPNVDGARETARRAIRDGNRVSDVIARLRALFSHKAFTPESIDLNDATREVIALSLNDLQRNRVIVQSELTNGAALVTGDRIQLQQVILNLLRNASDAMADVQDRPRQLLIRTDREGNGCVRLTVRDTGVGLGGQNMDKPFDSFYTTKSGGMGIGLSVSRAIIERHRGRLWAEHHDGPGATFAFSIPGGPEGVAHEAPAT